MNRACGAWLGYSLSRSRGGTKATTMGATSRRWMRLSSTVLIAAKFEVVGAVVHDEQRVAHGPVCSAPAGRGERAARDAAPCCAGRPRPARPGRASGSWCDPLGHVVAHGGADRARPHGPVRHPGVERVVEPLVVLAPPDLELVLDPRPLGQHRRRRPQVGVARAASCGSGSGSPTTRCRTQTSSASPRKRKVARSPSMIGDPCRAMKRSIAAASTGSRSRSRLTASRRSLMPAPPAPRRRPAAAPAPRAAAARMPRRHRRRHGRSPVAKPLTVPSSRSRQRWSRNRARQHGAPRRGRRAGAAGGRGAGRRPPAPGPARGRTPRPRGTLGARSRGTGRPRSVSAIAPADHATTGSSSGMGSANIRSVRSSVPTWPPVSTSAAHSPSIAASSPRCQRDHVALGGRGRASISR